MSRLTQRAALVTGASSGIGAAIAVRLAEEGVLGLVLSGRHPERLEETAIRCRRGGAQVVQHAAELATQAGVFAPGAVEAVAPEEFERQWRMNTWAPYALTHALLSSLKARRGQIVFINSGAGASALPNCSAYCASKFALRAVADSLRMELAPEGVRVVSAMLGKIATPLQERRHVQRTGVHHPGLYPSAADAAELVVAAHSSACADILPARRSRPSV